MELPIGIIRISSYIKQRLVAAVGIYVRAVFRRRLQRNIAAGILLAQGVILICCRSAAVGFSCNVPESIRVSIGRNLSIGAQRLYYMIICVKPCQPREEVITLSDRWQKDYHV
jgi:hypothetical protein